MRHDGVLDRPTLIKTSSVMSDLMSHMIMHDLLVLGAYWNVYTVPQAQNGLLLPTTYSGAMITSWPVGHWYPGKKEKKKKNTHPTHYSRTPATTQNLSYLKNQ